MWHTPSVLILPLGIALAWTVLLMSFTWLLARQINNYSVVDAVWSGGFSLLAVLYLGLAARHYYDAKLDIFPEWHQRGAYLLVGMVVLWSLRLGLHLAFRIARDHPKEDRRYAQLRENWGNQTGKRMYGFYLLQGALQCALSLPFLLACFNDRPPGPAYGFYWVELVGVGLWFIGWIGESVADSQLKRFRKRQNSESDNSVCQTGLWRYSRHPNYFFEWLIWVGFAFLALSAPGGWMGLLAPLLMWHFLVNVTGIPMTEALSVKSKGEAYRRYQYTTNAFFPGPTKTLNVRSD